MKKVCKSRIKNQICHKLGGRFPDRPVMEISFLAEASAISVSTSTAAEEKQNNPQAVIIAAASVITTAKATITAAAA